MAGTKRLWCPRCRVGEFPYAASKRDSSGRLFVKIRVCPVCGFERMDTHVVSYREGEAAALRDGLPVEVDVADISAGGSL